LTASGGLPKLSVAQGISPSICSNKPSNKIYNDDEPIKMEIQIRIAYDAFD
jgi:hypothetical protein